MLLAIPVDTGAGQSKNIDKYLIIISALVVKLALKGQICCFLKSIPARTLCTDLVIRMPWFVQA